MGDYTYTKSFTAVMENQNSYKLTINQRCVYEYDDVVWGEYKTRRQETSNCTELFLDSKEEVYKAILDNLIEYNNLDFKFTFESSQLDELINTNLKPITLCLKEGFTDVDSNRNYINISERNNYVYKEENDVYKSTYNRLRRNRRISTNRKTNIIEENVKIKVSEKITSISLRLNSLNTYLKDKNIDRNGFYDYVKEYMESAKGISVEVDFPISNYYDDLNNICTFNENDYFNIQYMLKDFKDKKFIFDIKEYDNIFYAIDDLEINHFNRPKDIKPLINDSNVVVFKCKLKKYPYGVRTLVLKKEDYNSKYDFISNSKDMMYDLKDIYLKNDRYSYNKGLELTTFELKREKILVICLYEIPDYSINSLKKYFDMSEYEEIVKNSIREQRIKYENDKSKTLSLNLNEPIETMDKSGAEVIQCKKNRSNLLSEINKFEIKIDGNGILYFMEYEPYWIRHDGIKEKNTKFKDIDSRILDLKKEDITTLNNVASNYFYDKMRDPLKYYFNKKNIEDVSVAIVPSHSVGKISTGLSRIARKICKDMGFEYRPSLLYRFKEIEKLSKGGNRNIQIHYNSIIVVGNSSNKTILLLDDVTTTGNSLLACKDILVKEGYNVICMAIAKTVRR